LWFVLDGIFKICFMLRSSISSIGTHLQRLLVNEAQQKTGSDHPLVARYHTMEPGIPISSGVPVHSLVALDDDGVIGSEFDSGSVSSRGVGMRLVLKPGLRVSEIGPVLDCE
jgi:hypothetical protein